MDFQDLKNKTVEELKEILDKSVKQVRALKSRAKLNQLKQSHELINLRQTVARLKMILKV